MSLGADPALGKILLVQRPNRGNIGNCIFLIVVSLRSFSSLPCPPLRWEHGSDSSGLVCASAASP